MRAPRWLLLPAALPMAAVAAFDPAGYAPFGPAKWMAISALVPAAAAGALWRRGPVCVARGPARLWVAFGSWTLFCALAGVDRWYALIGTPERHAGLLLWILAAAAFATGQRVCDAGGGRLVAQGTALAAAVTGAVSVVEVAWRAPVVTDATTARLGGPFGSAAYLGAACCLLGPAAVGVAVDRATARAWRAVAVAGAVGTLVGLAGSGTRGAWLGAALASAVVAACRRDVLRRRWRPVAVAGAVALALATLVAVAGPRRGADGSVLQRATPAAARLDEWRIAVRAVVERPLAGAGPEGYRARFPRLVDDRYERAYGRAVIPDRAHDGPLDMAVTVGLPGLLLYLALIAAVGRSVVRALRRGDALVSGLACGLVAYVAQQVVLFPLAELEPVAWLLAGVVVAADRRAGASAAKRVVPRVVPSVAALVAVMAVVAGARDLAADRAVRTALGGGAPAPAAAAGRRAVALRPDQVRYRIAAARALAPLDRRAALAELGAASRVSPGEPTLPVERAAIEGTVAGWRAALEVDPRRAASWLQLGLAAARAGDTDTALAAWTRAADLAPRDPVPWLDLARLALDQNRVTDARVAVEAARVRAAPADARVASLVAEVTRMGG